MVEDLLTEQILESTRDLDQRSTAEVLLAIHEQDRFALDAVGRVLPAVEQAAEILTLVLKCGGRWFNVGAGTSGRMGVLDASEVPPTFGYPPDRVQGVIAGGEKALSQAVEGAEDHPERAAFELKERGLSAGDAVLAISASGTTAFTLGAFDAAHEVGARTIALTCDPHSPLAEAAEVSIVTLVGPEVIAGSTRMKGGLAQKMVLHLLSTTVMIRLGYVSGNRMSSVQPAARKLRDRAVRILMSLGDMDRDRADALLEDCDGDVALAGRRAADR